MDMGRRRDGARRRQFFAYRWWLADKMNYAEGFRGLWTCPRCMRKMMKISLRKVSESFRRARFNCTGCGFTYELEVPVWMEKVDAFNALWDRVHAGEVDVV